MGCTRSAGSYNPTAVNVLLRDNLFVDTRGAVSKVCGEKGRERGQETDQVRCLGWGVTRSVAWYITGEGVGGGKRL